MYNITEVPVDKLNNEEFNNFRSKTLFTTVDWISFVEEDSKAKPIILKIEKDGVLVGYFSSLEVNKFGVKIIGSPFSGWSTCFMGFDVYEGVNKLDLVEPVSRYLFKEKKALLVEIIDRDIKCEEAKSYGYRVSRDNTLEVEIDKTDEELFKVFKTDARNFIRQFERRGATIEYAIPDDAFAEDYYNQLIDVFAKQGLVPTYSLEKVKCLLRHLKNEENILCLRVRDPEGNCIATSIFLGYNRKFFFWGGASYRSGQHYRPNEYMIWTAIRFWRDKGIEVFDMVGVRDYKRKFGSHEVEYAHISIPKYSCLLILRDTAKWCYFSMLKIKGKLLKRK